MWEKYFGEIISLFTALFWTFTALSFEFAGKRIGSLSVNIIRLVFGFSLLGIFSFISKGYFFPTDAGQHQWIWLPISGLVGFVIGDLLLFKAFTIIGARISMLLMALSPPFAAILGWLLLDETLSLLAITGMIITFTGIAWVILQKGDNNKKIEFSFSPKGILLALGGSIGQATGLVLSKYGMADYDSFSSTQIRVLTGLAGFIIIVSVLKRWSSVFSAFKQKQAIIGVGIGSFFGPFLGVSFSLLAIKNTSTGIASTLMSIVPVLIIPFSIFLFKEKFVWKELLGAIITVIGVCLFFI